MQGYILSTRKQKNEDLIVTILTQSAILNLYRFYGARHSIVHIGHKIDFVSEHNGLFMPKLRNIIHLGFRWERDLERVYVWRRFIELLSAHLRDIHEIDSRYFEILDSGASKLLKQNPLRVALEMYAEILQSEGRNHLSESCFLCGEDINDEEIALVRGFLSVHTNCASNLKQSQKFNKTKIKNFLSRANSIELNDEEIAKAYQVLLLGM